MIFRSIVLGVLAALVVVVAARPGDINVVVAESGDVAHAHERPVDTSPSSVTLLAGETMLVDVDWMAATKLARAFMRADHPGDELAVWDPASRGLRIVHVEPDSVAASFGLRPGDVIVGVDDAPLTGGRVLAGRAGAGRGELARRLLSPRGYADIDIVRDGRPVRLVVLVHGTPPARLGLPRLNSPRLGLP